MRTLVRVARHVALVASGLGACTTIAGAQALQPDAVPSHLSALADSVAQYLVFMPSVDSVFLAATRARRLLVDIGHVDLNVRATPRRLVAYRQAVRALTPLPVGTAFRVVGAWGSETVEISGFDWWNGRIVATVRTSRTLDSLVRHGHVPVAVAYRLDSAAAAATDMTADSTRAAGDTTPSPPAGRDSCPRDSLSPALASRAAIVRDSIEQWLRGGELPPYPRLQNSLRSVSTQIVGCFGHGRRLALAVDLRAGSNEWIRERMVLLDSIGRVTNLRVNDYRFRGHDLVAAFDADGDGIDDIAVKGYTAFAGGLAVLKLVGENRLQRLASGFAWESE